MIVDAHAHFLPYGMIEALRAKPTQFPSVRIVEDNGPCFSFLGEKPTRPVSKRLYDTTARQQWLSAQGIDRQIVGGWLDIFGYDLPADEGSDWCRFMNGHLLSSGVEAFAPLACVPMQDGVRAAQVLAEALDAGFSGAIIGTQPKGTGGNLDDPGLDPFWQVASDRGATLFVHPMIACCEPRLDAYDLVNSVGRVMDTTAAIARLLCSGHLQRFPGVKLLLSHGGAALPYILGRLEKSYQAHGRVTADPRDGFERMYYDTVLFDSNALRFLCSAAGADHVLMGTDHPFLFGDEVPLASLDDAGLSTVERSLVAGENATRLFNLAACNKEPHGGKT